MLCLENQAKHRLYIITSLTQDGLMKCTGGQVQSVLQDADQLHLQYAYQRLRAEMSIRLLFVLGLLETVIDPLGSTRLAKLVGKYAGGVFCRLYDGVTTILCSYLSMQYDGDFHEGDIVEVIINKYNYDTKQVYGKILRKIGN